MRGKAIVSLIAVILFMALFNLDCHKSGTPAMVVNVTPGLWQITVTEGLKGMPGTQKTKTETHCITDSDLQKGAGQWIAKVGGCKNDDYVASGNTMSWRMKCTGEYAGTGTGSIDFEGDTYSSSASIKVTYYPYPTLQVTFDGKRTGDCK